MTKIKNFYVRHSAINKERSKLDYFFLAIIIGMLSLSIQTYNIDENYHANSLVIGTWILLLISFFAGLIIVKLRIKYNTFSLGHIKYEENLAHITENVNIIRLHRFSRDIDRFTLGQYVSFLMAIICYALFKISNIYCLSDYVLILILIIAFISGFSGIKILKKYVFDIYK